MYMHNINNKKQILAGVRQHSQIRHFVPRELNCFKPSTNQLPCAITSWLWRRKRIIFYRILQCDMKLCLQIMPSMIIISISISNSIQYIVYINVPRILCYQVPTCLPSGFHDTFKIQQLFLKIQHTTRSSIIFVLYKAGCLPNLGRQ